MATIDENATRDRSKPQSLGAIWRRLTDLGQQAGDLDDRRQAGEITDEEFHRALWSIAEEQSRLRAEILAMRGSRLASAFVAAVLAGLAAGIQAYSATSEPEGE